jgi:hypothetical protein
VGFAKATAVHDRYAIADAEQLRQVGAYEDDSFAVIR